MQAAEVDDAPHTGGRGRSRDRRGHMAFGALEVARTAHGVHEVVEDIHPHDRPLDVGGAREIAREHLDLVHPRNIAQACGVADDDAHLVPGLEQPRNEPAADVAGRPGDEHPHAGHGRPAGWELPRTRVAAQIRLEHANPSRARARFAQIWQESARRVRGVQGAGEEERRASIPPRVVAWFAQNARDLPWRRPGFSAWGVHHRTAHREAETAKAHRG